MHEGTSLGQVQQAEVIATPFGGCASRQGYFMWCDGGINGQSGLHEVWHKACLCCTGL